MANERPARTEQLAVDKHDRMSEIETAYLRAKAYEKSPQFATDVIKALGKVRAILRLGLVTESEGLLMVGRLQQVILDTFAHEDVIIEYEGLKSTLRQMLGEK